MSLTAWQRLLTGLLVVVLAALAWGIARTRDDLPPPPDSQKLQIDKGNAQGHRFKSRTANWALDYDRLTISPDQSYAELENVRDGTFFRAGKPYMTISAKHVTVNVNTSDFTATGKIHIRTLDDKKRTFDSDSVSWANVTQMLTLDHPVTASERDGTKVRFTKGTVDVKKGEAELEGLSADLGV
jgi:LPS export ABC transporter protein LptC